ncbi:MAG: NADPH:quinone reductase [Deltaproteobacteria bacterium]|nr:NADPH:quinone reductase [Deltaproteobacteria bacterium]
MKAVWYERVGPAAEVLKLGDLPVPEPGRGEVRVRLRASAVNPSDAKTRAGISKRPTMFPRIIPHSDGAGVIDGVGEGVPKARIGERVWLYNAQWERPFGTAAEFVALPSDLAVSLPENVGFAEGACLGIPVMTAHRCLLGDGSVAGRTVLVAGGAGVVGHYAIQLAKWSQAKVVTTVSSPAKAAHARAAGADHVIDYKREAVAERVLEITSGRGVDRVVEVDLGANLPILPRVLKPNGTVAAYASMGVREPVLPVYPLMMRNTRIDLVLVYTMPEEAKRRAIIDIGAWLATGSAQFAIAARFPLERLAEAHDLVERGDKLGHVVVDIEP